MRTSSKRQNQNTSPSGTKKNKGAGKRGAGSKERLQRIKLQRQLLSAGGIAILLIIFALCVIFMGQLYVISHLDNEVTELQNTYDSVKGLNDSRDGQIIEKLGYPQIEAMAAGYGMSPPTEDQLVTESVTVQQIDESGWNETKWYHRFFQ